MGLKYDALKDFVKWSIPEEFNHEEVMKKYVPLLLNLGRYYSSILNETAK